MPVWAMVGVAMGTMAGLAGLVAAVFYVRKATGRKRLVKVDRESGGKAECDTDQESVLSGLGKGER